MSGSVPTQLGLLVALDDLSTSSLSLRTNRLSGTLPPELGQLAMLSRTLCAPHQARAAPSPRRHQARAAPSPRRHQARAARHSRLVASRSPHRELLSCRRDLSVNSLSGSIPSQFGKLTNLGNPGTLYARTPSFCVLLRAC